MALRTTDEYGTWFVLTLGGAQRYVRGWLSADAELGLLRVYEWVGQEDGVRVPRTLLAVNLGALELYAPFEGDLDDAQDD